MRHRPEPARGRPFEAVLGDCLDALFTGATVEDCLILYPNEAERLAPLLRLALEIVQTPTPHMLKSDFEYGRRRVRETALAMRDGHPADPQVGVPAPRSPVPELEAHRPEEAQPPRRRLFSLVDAVVLVGILLAVMVTFGMPFLLDIFPLAIPTQLPTATVELSMTRLTPTRSSASNTPSTSPAESATAATATSPAILPASSPSAGTPTRSPGPRGNPTPGPDKNLATQSVPATTLLPFPTTTPGPGAVTTPAPASPTSRPSPTPAPLLTKTPVAVPSATAAPFATHTPAPTASPTPLPSATLSPTSTGTPSPTQTATPASSAGRGDPMALIRAVNRERQRRGLSTLRVNEALMAAARAHSVDLATNNRWGHIGSDGSTPQDRMRRAGYPLGAGEELLAANSTDVDAIVNLWLRSPEHQSIFLNPEYVDIGAGYAYNANADYLHYWTVLMARPAAAPPPVDTPTSTPEPAMTPSSTPTPTVAGAATPSPTPSPFPTASEVPTLSPAPPTSTPTIAEVPTPTATPYGPPKPTVTPTAMDTPAPTGTTRPPVLQPTERPTVIGTPISLETPAPTITPLPTNMGYGIPSD